jgi:hypothetical protein
MSNESEYFTKQSKSVQAVLNRIQAIMESHACTSYVKTIYVGFDLEDKMVAAAYPHAEHVELALALEEDHEDPRLLDASHLTWRTLPLSLELRSTKEVDDHQELLVHACQRVRTGGHDVNRDNEFFNTARRDV